MPFDHVRAGCDLVVAVDVTGRPRSTGRIHPTNRELALGSMFIMFHQIARLRRSVSPPDIYVEPPVDQFKGNQFFRSQELFDAAEPAKEWLKRALESRHEEDRVENASSVLNRLAAILEELNQQGAGRFGADAAIDFRAMMAGRLLEEARAVFDRAHLLIRRAEIEPADAGEGNGGGAHGARLERDIEIAIGEPLAAELASGLADGQQFGMGGRVAVGERAVAGCGDDGARRGR